jgi:hypothetical protein
VRNRGGIPFLPLRWIGLVGLEPDKETDRSGAHLLHRVFLFSSHLSYPPRTLKWIRAPNPRRSQAVKP